MIRSTLAAAAILSIAMVGAPSLAAPCKDAKTGKFIKCPPPAAATSKKAVCRDSKGHFAKCGTPGATPSK